MQTASSLLIFPVRAWVCVFTVSLSIASKTFLRVDFDCFFFLILVLLLLLVWFYLLRLDTQHWKQHWRQPNRFRVVFFLSLSDYTLRQNNQYKNVVTKSSISHSLLLSIRVIVNVKPHQYHSAPKYMRYRFEGRRWRRRTANGEMKKKKNFTNYCNGVGDFHENCVIFCRWAGYGAFEHSYKYAAKLEKFSENEWANERKRRERKRQWIKCIFL